MKTIYTRFGHANNSSSSHSIVFLDREVSDSDAPHYDEYHWNDFTLGSRLEKERYLFSQLYVNVESMIYGRYDVSELMGFGEAESARRVIISNWFQNRRKTIAEHFQFVDTFYADVIEEAETESPSVDHQSAFAIPTNATTGRLDLDFFLEFADEVLKPGYAILGGNDNDDWNNPLYKEDKGVAKIVSMMGVVG